MTVRSLGERGFINKILVFLEKNRTNLISGSILLFIYVFIRLNIEFYLYNRNPQTGTLYVEIFNTLGQVLFFYLMFLAGLLIISFFAKESARKVANVLLIGFALIIIGPPIDYFFLERRSGYDFIGLGDFEGLGLGLLLQVMFMLVLALIYTFLKSNSIWQTVKVALCLGLFMVAVGAFLPLYIFDFLLQYFDMKAAQATGAFLAFIVIVILAALILDNTNKRILPRLLKNLRLTNTLIFLFITILGVAFAGRFLFAYEKDALIYIDHVPYAVILVITVVFAAQSFFMFSDIYEADARRITNKKNPLKKGTFTRSQYVQFTTLMAIISLGFGFTLGFAPVILTLIFLLSGWAYASRLLKLKLRIAESLIIGFLFSLVFLIGYYVTSQTAKFDLGYYILEMPALNSYGISPWAVAAVVMVFLVAFLGRYLLFLRR